MRKTVLFSAQQRFFFILFHSLDGFHWRCFDCQWLFGTYRFFFGSFITFLIVLLERIVFAVQFKKMRKKWKRERKERKWKKAKIGLLDCSHAFGLMKLKLERAMVEFCIQRRQSPGWITAQQHIQKKYVYKHKMETVKMRLSAINARCNAVAM